MTANDISDYLSQLGIHYSANSVRKAWAKGAPRDSAEAFALWLASHSDYSTDASNAARRALKLDGSDSSVEASPSENPETLDNEERDNQTPAGALSFSSSAHAAKLACAMLRKTYPAMAVFQVATWSLFEQIVRKQCPKLSDVWMGNEEKLGRKQRREKASECTVFVRTLMELAVAQNKAAKVAMKLERELKAAGFTSREEAWLDYAETDEGISTVVQMWVDAHKRAFDGLV